MKNYKIAAIPADGIGPEVIAAGLQALEALASRDGGFELDVTEFDWGSERYKRTGALMPEDGKEQLKDFDAIFFGAVGAPDVPDHVTLWGLRLPICQGFDQYANVRPTRILPGITSPLAGVGPDDLDWVIVRENSEGSIRVLAVVRIVARPKKSQPRFRFLPGSVSSGSCAMRLNWRNHVHASF